jgi:AmmeMemoRadiSam system protein B
MIISSSVFSILLLSLILIPAITLSESVRPAILSGTWYKGTQEALINQVDSFLERVRIRQAVGNPIALISPHAGYDYSGPTAAYGYRAIMGIDFQKVIVIAPSHRVPFSGISIGDFDYFETPLGRIRVDRKDMRLLLSNPIFKSLMEVHRYEHSLEIQLPFLQRVLKDWRLIPLIVGDLRRNEYRNAAAEISKLADSKTLIVASSDFTHYGSRFGYVPFRERIPENIQKLDQGAIEKILSMDFNGFMDYCERTEITICGFRAIGILLNLLPPGSKGYLLHYDASGRILNDYENSVSYASIIFSRPSAK